jgi:hypothetical protein
MFWFFFVKKNQRVFQATQSACWIGRGAAGDYRGRLVLLCGYRGMRRIPARLQFLGN